MEKVYCTKCNGIAVKNGFQGKKQRYKCKLCQKKFQLDFAYKAYSKSIVGFVLGSKTKENIRSLVNELILSAPKYIYTDGLNIYTALIPKAIHKRFQYCTNIIERNNLTLRTHLKRLGRRTICFSRSAMVLLSVLKIYF